MNALLLRATRLALLLGLSSSFGAATLLVAPTPAEAQDRDVARETFRAGEAAYARGDYEAAAKAFEVSNRLAPHPFTMFNAGLAWEAAGQKARAADAFERALDSGGLGESQAAEAQSRLSKLSADFGEVDVEVPEKSVIRLGDGREVTGSATFHLLPGDHEIRVEHADGRSEAKRVSVTQGARASVTFVVAVAPPPTPPPPPSVPGGGDEPSAGGGPGGLAIGGFVLIGVGAIAGGAAIGVGVQALAARDDYDASGNRDADARSKAASLRTVTNVLWAGAGALAIAGTVMVIVGWEDEGDASVSLEIGPASLGLRGRF